MYLKNRYRCSLIDLWSTYEVVFFWVTISLLLAAGCYRTGSGKKSAEDKPDGSAAIVTDDSSNPSIDDTQQDDPTDSELISDSSTTSKDSDTSETRATDAGSDPIDSATDSIIITDTGLDTDTDDNTASTDTDSDTGDDTETVHSDTHSEQETESDNASETTTYSDAGPAVDCVGESVWYNPATTLCWQIVPDDKDVSFVDAWNHCESAVTGGYADWALPDAVQLRTMIYGCSATETGSPYDCFGPEPSEECGGCGVKDNAVENRCYRHEQFGSQCVGEFWTATHTYYEMVSVIDFERAAIGRDWPGDSAPEPGTVPLPSKLNRTWCVRQTESQ